MSLFTFNSRRLKGFSGPLVGFSIFVGINLLVAALPPGSVREQFEHDLKKISRVGAQADVFVFKTSKTNDNVYNLLKSQVFLFSKHAT